MGNSIKRQNGSHLSIFVEAHGVHASADNQDDFCESLDQRRSLLALNVVSAEAKLASHVVPHGKQLSPGPLTQWRQDGLELENCWRTRPLG